MSDPTHDGTSCAAGTNTAHLFAVVGATGTGKSDFALDLVDALGGHAEIVNADAMQLYRGMDIGTAKLTLTERRGIPHHLLDVLDVTDDAAVAVYQAAARETITGIQSRGKHAVLVGGSGLYVSSVIFDFAFPPRDPALRAELEQRLTTHGVGSLLARLHELDHRAAANVDAANTRRVVRALEVAELGAAGHGAALPSEPAPWQASTIIGLADDRDVLVERLDLRVERMWRAGMLDETRTLRDRGLERGTTAPRAIGYAQALAQLRGEATEAEAIAETQALTRRYARRQVSWFKRYRAANWLNSRDEDARQRLLSDLAR